MPMAVLMPAVTYSMLHRSCAHKEQHARLEKADEERSDWWRGDYCRNGVIQRMESREGEYIAAVSEQMLSIHEC